MPHWICPDSIIAARIVRLFTKPRHALETSKICAAGLRPIFRWAKAAVAGSIMSRHTAACMNASI